MASGRTDRTGQRFGRWTVLRLSGRTYTQNGKTRVFWVCRCDCGGQHDVQADDLVQKKSRSCMRCARRNRRDVLLIRWGEHVLPLNQWAVLLDIGESTLYRRIANGWDLAEALTVSVDPVLLQLLVPDQNTGPVRVHNEPDTL